jgi:hypothetical protein
MPRRRGLPGAVVAVTALVITVLIGPAARADARDCRAEVLLPADVRLVAPATDLPAAIARFGGTWLGTWTFGSDRDTLCAALVVEEVLGNGYARVVYGHGTWAPHEVRQPGFYRATGKIVDGVLSFTLPVPGRPAFVYRFTDGALSGTYRGRGDHAAMRVTDVGQLGCRATIPAVGPPPGPAAPRDRLTADDLLGTRSADDGPVHNDYFMPLGQTGAARHALKGTLTVAAASMSSAHGRCRALDVATPAVSIDVFTHGGHLVPVVRGIIGGALIVSPGRVWSEPGDRGLSRASFPFVMVNQLDNATHNGLATFLFDATRVSPLRFQVVQETAEWAKHDYWGQASMTYTPRALAGETALRARFDDEISRRTPVRPWSALPAAARGPALDGIDGDVPTEDVSASGLVVDGVVYLRGCNTRHGPYPYCREMRHGVFSVTKSLAGAVALLRLARKYGDDVFDAKIKDYVSVTATHDGWDDVTFADALGMATGIGELSPERWPNEFSADENKPRMLAWVTKRTAREKLEAAFAYPRYPWRRAEVVRYNSTHTFVLAAAMDAYLKRKAGPSARLWDMVTREVFEPIGIFVAPLMHTLEADGSRGIPLMAYGLYPTIDDVAKLAALLQNGGRHDGRQLLSAAKLAEALYRTSPPNGLPLGRPNRFGEALYHLSFWSMPYRTSTGCFLQIPYMAGYGGNIVALLPNGVSAFRFADAMIYDVPALIRAGEAIRPFCPAATTTAAPPARSPMTASELRAELAGRTFDSGVSRWVLDPSGVAWAEAKSDFDVGRWHITDDGKYCRTWNVWERGLPGCFTVYRDGETFELQSLDRWTLIRVKRAPPVFQDCAPSTAPSAAADANRSAPCGQ